MTTSLRLICCLTLLACPMAWAQDVPAEPPKTPATSETPDKPAVAKRKTDADKARGILAKADAELKKIKSVKYTVRSQRIDVSDNAASKMIGPVIASGWNEATQTPKKFRYEVTTYPAGRTDSATVITGYDGEQFWAMNVRDKKTFAGGQLSSIGPYQAVVAYFPTNEFMLPEPLGDELRGQVIELVDELEVGGEPCYEIRVAYSGSGQSATWFISTKDYLPRRVDRVIVDPAGDTVTRASFISDIVVDPELPEGVFDLVFPPDFVKEAKPWP